MARHPIALALSPPYPPLPSAPVSETSPLQELVEGTLSGTDYDLVCLPLTNDKWQDRWERLCLRPLDDEEGSLSKAEAATRAKERERDDREADIWRRDGGLKREEMNVSRLDETRSLIALASDWLELDSPDEGIRFDSELALRSEMAQAIYLSLPTLIIPAPQLSNRAHLLSYARAISNLLQVGGPSPFTQISIRIPISDPQELIHQGPGPNSPNAPNAPNGIGMDGTHPFGIPQSNSAGTGSRHHKRISSLSIRPTSMHQSQLHGQNMRVPSAASAASSTMSAKSAGGAVASGDPSSTWEMWDTIRTVCGYHPRLSVTLDLTNPLPPSVGALARWTAEPVRYVWLPAPSFIPNAKGYPVLSKACQAFLKDLRTQNPTYILSQTTHTRHTAGGPTAYLQYVRHITSQPPSATSTSSMGRLLDGPEYAQGYGDFLQAPLQPLMDNLGSITYEMFEKDPVKYRQYEEAIYLALMDLPANKKLVVSVMGAGRGPLVDCTLRALQRSSRTAKVYAVEKNSSAIVTLEDRQATEWKDKVTLISGDMRTLPVPELADIIVSELLGSFGDNELSPECLDGASRFLKPDGISIPTSYTAHLAPISSSKLHADVTSSARPSAAGETPWVVMMQQVNILSGDGGGLSGRCGERVQQCWQFVHPRRDIVLDEKGVPITNSHNTRSATLTFHIPHASPLHGLAGYFESHLYSNIGLSIHPENMHRVSPGMMSWFPLFFPFKEPLYLPGGSELEVGIWRLSDSGAVGGAGGGRGKIWYEWGVEVFLPVHPSQTQSQQLASAALQAGGSNPSSAGLSLSPNVNANGGGVGGATVNGRSPNGTGAPSPMMDAPPSAGLSSGGFGFGFGMGAPSQGQGQEGEGRIKIGGTRLHNSGGTSSWVGL